MLRHHKLCETKVINIKKSTKMFLNLTRGSQVYILHHTSNNPYVEVGTIEMLSNAMPMYYPNMPISPLDISVRIGDKVVPFRKIPANAEVAELKEENGTEALIIATSKEGINNELRSLRQKSVDAVNSVDFHRARIGLYDKLLTDLNPEEAEKARQTQEINDLKEQMAELIRMNRVLMEKVNGEGTSS